MIDAYENDWVDKAEFEPRVRAAKDRLARDEAALAEQQRESIDADELRLVIGRFNDFAERMRENLEHADFATKRQLLRLLINRIEVSDEDIRIVYKVSPRPFAGAPINGGILQDCLKFHLKAQGRRFGRTLGNGGRRRPTPKGFNQFTPTRNVHPIRDRICQMIPSCRKGRRSFVEKTMCK